MIYRCQTCGHEVAFGCLPSATCGTYFLALVGLEAFALSVGLPALRRLVFPDAAPPWWGWLLLAPLAAAGFVVGAIALNFVSEALERLLVRARRCPACGTRRWSRGFTRGFGL